MIEDMTYPGGCRLFFFVGFLICTSSIIIHATPRDLNGKMFSPWSLDLQNKLATLNKRPIKSVEIPNGDIIDCVNIYEQPAFDHPLLKHHKIQMRPTSYPKDSVGSNNDSNKISQLWHWNESCPKGTIPIRRTKMTDLLRAKSLKRFGTKKKVLIARQLNTSKLNNDPRQGHEYALTYLDAQLGDTYYGAKATMNVWNSNVQDNREYSTAEMIILGGPVNKDGNAIQAGWQVNPTLFGDRKPRVFIYWSSDGYKSTGCFNLLCPGFVQVDRSIPIGGEISPISKYGDRIQYSIILSIFQDRKTGNWWLKYGPDKGTVMGYWPKSLFTYLAKGAETIQWGGDVINLKVGGQHTTTQMGSGHFSGEGLGKASFFRNIKYVDYTNSLVDPIGWKTYTSKGTSNCYDIKKFDTVWNYGYYFFYGGPGRNNKCP